jgi:hypothetical protein
LCSEHIPALFRDIIGFGSMSGNVLTKENCSYGINSSPVGRHCYLLIFFWLHIVTSDVGPESSWGEGRTANVSGDLKATELSNPAVAEFWDI